jgi:hypothetical protein
VETARRVCTDQVAEFLELALGLLGASFDLVDRGSPTIPVDRFARVEVKAEA